MRRNDAGDEPADRLAGVPRHPVADAAEAPAGDGDLCLQHVAHARAEREIGMANDRLGDAAAAVIARSAHGGDAVDELDLADRRHLGGAMLAVHRLTFEEHRGDDVVAAADIGEQFRQEVAAALRRIPEMMVRIDDRQIRLERCLGRTLRQPRLQLGVAAVDQAAIVALGIAWLRHFHPLVLLCSRVNPAAKARHLPGQSAAPG